MNRIAKIKAKLKEAKLVYSVTTVDKRDYINDIEHLLSLLGRYEADQEEFCDKILKQKQTIFEQEVKLKGLEWVPVEERLPYFGVKVLVHGCADFDKNARRIYTAHASWVDWLEHEDPHLIWVTENSWGVYNVTDWLPLPPPPEKRCE